ncbi:MAG: hypothetical protein IK089_01810 [Oxalobacter sp.]|nr:hypothetical protein [Oxalobacter sp.]
MRKALIPATLLFLLLTGCNDSPKPTEASQPAPQPTASSEPKEAPKPEEKPADPTEEKTVSTGLGITTNTYQATYNAHVDKFNAQMKQDPVRMTKITLKVNGKQFSACPMSYACINGTLTEDEKYIDTVSISGTLTLKEPKSLALAPVHMMMGTVSAIQEAAIPDIKDMFDKLSKEAENHPSKTASMVIKGCKITFSHPRTEKIVLTVSKAPAK